MMSWQSGPSEPRDTMSLWLEVFLALSVALVLCGVLISGWLVLDWLWHRNRSGRALDAAEPAPVVRGGLDYRDHPGPVVERRGPSVSERRYRDAVDRSSGQNPRT